MTRDKVRWHLLEWEGVDHDVHKYGKPVDRIRPARGYECAVCSAWIMPKEPGDSPFVGGPLDGKWLVTNGSSRIYAPVIQPIRWAEEPNMVPLMPVVEYERDPRGTYRVAA